jgi:Holliday junction resolvase
MKKSNECALRPNAMNSRAKGKAGELELAAVLREHGFGEARRGAQYSGSNESPDVVGLPGYHIECKRCEAGSLYTWLAQATRDSDGSGRVPVVIHRKSRQQWVAILPLTAFLRIAGGQG